MNAVHLTSVFLDRRGAALPMAMLSLLILSVLIIGFSVLSATEPTIANNQLRVAQARALAESGVERAIWALNQGITNPACSPTVCPPETHAIPASFTTAPAEYNNGPLVTLATGGFRVTVINGATNERGIAAMGWVPDDTNPKARQKIVVTARMSLGMPDPPAALTVRGDLQMGGNSFVDSSKDQKCGLKAGTVTRDLTQLGGSTKIVGGDGTAITKNETPTDAGQGAIPTTGAPSIMNVADSAFDPFMLSDGSLPAPPLPRDPDEIGVLRDYAKAHGTYLKGSQTFDSSNPLPNGFVFVDTTIGTNITPQTSVSDFASVTIHGNAGTAAGGAFNGWLFVNGGLSISGDFVMNGFVYAQNDISYQGTGQGQIKGAVVSRNIRDTVSTSIYTDNVLGNAQIVYDCEAARTGGGSARWSLKSGTYKEVSGGS